MTDFAWACTCGRGGGAWTPSVEQARRDGEIHACRSGRLRELHHVVVRSRAGMA